jgi:L-ribulose-5-phosphate 3-epimerase UlaE
VMKPVQGYCISGAPLGDGCLNVPRVMESISRFSRNPNILVELWVDQEQTMEVTLQKEEAWVRESVKYVKSLNDQVTIL